MVTMPMSSVLSDGKATSWLILDGASYHSWAGLDYVLGVSYNPVKETEKCNTDNQFPEDFALMEASYTIIRILQTFSNIRLPPNHLTVPTGQERQNLTIVVSSADGCKVQLN